MRCGHRLQSSVGVVFTREDVKRALKNARSAIAWYKGSSQAQAHLNDRCEGVKIKRISIFHDVPIRWSSTITKFTEEPIKN